MQFKLPKEVLQIFERFQRSGFEIYLVGGAVRDLLTGRPAEDWDFATNATPEKILKLFPDAFYKNDFGTVGIPSKNFEPHEVTTYRKEFGYSDKRRPDKVSWGKTIEDDLKRRDFTINAIALSHKLEIKDPENGQKDLEKKIIRAVGDPNERFSEDALRMMRAIRIASELGFTIEDKTLLAIKANASLINRIAKERVKEELFKTLGSPHPFEGMILFRESSLMQEILPEMEKTFGVEQKSPQRHHIYDVGTHSLYALKECRSTDPVVRFATMIHDIGKPQTYKKLESGVITFYNHEVVSGKIAERIAERLRLSNEERDKLYKLVRFHQFTVDEHQTDSAIRRFITRVGKQNLEDMLTLRVADRLGGGARETSWRLEEFKKRLIEVQKQPFSLKDLRVSGQDVMKTLGIVPSPKVGEILEELFKEVVSKKVENDRDILLKKLKDLKAKS